MTLFNQQEFDIRFEWGARGVDELAPISDVVIIVDVLSFTTCVDVAVSRGAIIFPYRGPAEELPAYAASVGAEWAGHKRSANAFTLSPTSLCNIPSGTRLVLPSPNGSTLTLAAKPTPVIAGCLRNAEAVAQAANGFGQKITVIAAGERWRSDNSLRPTFEDFLGAGAIIHHLEGRLSPEALSAASMFRSLQAEIGNYMNGCSSGKELIEGGFEQDVTLASQLNVSGCAPVLVDDAYVQG
jgi:2-phosphosulfolactate phosphatase